MLRTGPYGDGFGARPGRPQPRRAGGQPPRHRLRAAGAAPAGRPCARRAARSSWLRPSWSPTASAWPARCRRHRAASCCSSGRRNLRSNNSWMHNINVLVKGRAQCTLQVHPDDAERLGLVDGEAAMVASRVGRVRGPGRAHRRHPARRGEPPARLGPRSRRHGPRRRRGPRGSQLEHLGRPRSLRSRSPATPSSTASRSRWHRAERGGWGSLCGRPWRAATSHGIHREVHRVFPLPSHRVTFVG